MAGIVAHSVVVCALIDAVPTVVFVEAWHSLWLYSTECRTGGLASSMR